MATIGVHTHITNPHSSGYLSYLACIESWARVADEVVVVDGGSTDGSLEYLSDWLGCLSEKTRIVSVRESYWGTGDRWNWPQIAINRQIGLENLSTDWAIHVDADHLVDNKTMNIFSHQLKYMSDKLLLSMWVGYYLNGMYHKRQRRRAWILNLRKVRNEGLNVAYGIENFSGTGLDYPIWIKETREFIDPDTSYKKYYYYGESIISEGDVDLECIRYGHFFFSMKQCAKKCMRIERAISRFCGGHVKSKREIEIELKLNDIVRYESKEEVLSKIHPEEATKVIDKYYCEGMIGGALYRKRSFMHNVLDNAFVFTARLLRYLHRRIQKIRGKLW